MSENANIEIPEHLDFKCPVSKNVIEFRCFKKNRDAYMEYVNIDYDVPKAFFVILRQAIDKLKNLGYDRIVQTVLEEDWNNSLKHDKWVIKHVDKGIQNLYVIQCNIDDALENISYGLGFETKI